MSSPLQANVERRFWQRLLGRVVAYYLALLFGLLTLLYVFPGLEPYLPVGGLERFDDSATFEEVISTYREEVQSADLFRGVYRLMEALLMSVSIGLTLLTMVPIVWTYRASYARSDAKKKDVTVLETLVVLPVVITAIVLIIQNSIALAFGLAGIVAGVQYRNRLALSVDAAYLFAAIAIGIASGIEALGIAIIMSMWFCVTIIGMKLWREPAPERAVQAENSDGS